jgi:hypothetical protein
MAQIEEILDRLRNKMQEDKSLPLHHVSQVHALVLNDQSNG